MRRVAATPWPSRPIEPCGHGEKTTETSSANRDSATWHALIELAKPEDDETDRELTFSQTNNDNGYESDEVDVTVPWDAYFVPTNADPDPTEFYVPVPLDAEGEPVQRKIIVAVDGVGGCHIKWDEVEATVEFKLGQPSGLSSAKLVDSGKLQSDETPFTVLQTAGLGRASGPGYSTSHQQLSLTAVVGRGSLAVVRRSN